MLANQLDMLDDFIDRSANYNEIRGADALGNVGGCLRDQASALAVARDSAFRPIPIIRLASLRSRSAAPTDPPSNTNARMATVSNFMASRGGIKG